MFAKEVERRARAGQQISIPDLAKATGRNRDAFYRAVARGEIAAVRLGSKSMVLPGDALRMLGLAPDESAALAA